MTDQRLNLPLKKFFILNFLSGIFLLLAGIVSFSIGWRQANSEILLVFTFHGVTEQPTMPWELRYSELQSYIHRLKKFGFESLPPRQFESWLRGSLSGGRKFLITFDDGLLSSVEAIKRLKNEENVDSLLFIPTDLIGKPYYCKQEDISAVASFGTLIGCHGKRHEELPSLLASGVNLIDELAAAKKSLENLAGEKVEFFAYPFGKFDPASRDAVASSGFKFAFTVDSGEVSRCGDPLLIPRLMFLRGVEQFGEKPIGDWIPPERIRNSGLTLILAFLVTIWGLGCLFRSFKYFQIIKTILKGNSDEHPKT